MNLPRLASVILFFSIASSGVHAADDKLFLQLLTCQESWMDWQKLPKKWTYFQSRIDTDLRRFESTGQYFPVKPMTLLGLKVVDVYPHMATDDLGFSVIFDSTFDKIKAALEKQVGTRLEECAMANGRRMCAHSFAAHRHALLTENGVDKNAKTLLSCHYDAEIRN